MAKLDFPANPVMDQEYHFPPFIYRWDGEKWKTLGRASDPVAIAIEEHKEDSNAHDPKRIGALPLNGSSPMTGPLNVTTNTSEAIVLNYAAGGPGSYIRGKEGGNNDWYIGRANDSGHVALYSDKLTNGLVIRDDYIEAVKPLRMGQNFVYLYNQRAGTTNLNDLFSSAHCGMYYQDSSSQATGARNYPFTEAGTLLVSGSAYGVQQEYTTYSSYRKFVRGQGAAGGQSWFPWKEIGGPKHHLSGYNINPITIAPGQFGVLVPRTFPSNSGISSGGGSGVYNITKDAVYKISFGYSIEPAAGNQQGVGSIFINGTNTLPSVNYNYCPMTTQALQMGTSDFSCIYSLKAGDRVEMRVQAVNGTSVKIYQAGFITIEELYVA